MNITLNLTLDEVNRILTIIAERPLVQVIDIFAKIRTQSDQQMKQGEGS